MPIVAFGSEMTDQFTEHISEQFSPTEKKRIARELVAKILDKRFDKVLLSELVLTSEQEREFLSMIDRINGGEPLQYVTGLVEFCGLELEVDNRVLIPRPETEEMVQIASKMISERDSQSILDVGSGSGCIILAISNLNSSKKCVGIDISDASLEVARANNDRVGLSVDFQKCDALNGNVEGTFDMIISNPPYVLKSDRKKMSSTVYDYEPDLALFVEDDDPLLFYRAIAEKWVHNLNKGGVIVLEVHQDLAGRVAGLFKSANFDEVEIRKDFYGNDRFVICA